jgi:hypothetical protein
MVDILICSLVLVAGSVLGIAVVFKSGGRPKKHRNERR